MELFYNHFIGFLYLFGGAALVIAAVQLFVKQRSIPGTAVCLAFAAAFTAVGLCNVLELMAPESVGVSENAVLGILLVFSGISGLYSPPSPSHPGWTKWAMLVFGVGYVLASILGGVRYYWR